MPTSEVRIEDFRAEFLEPLITLFRTYHPPESKLLTPEYNRWLYLGNPEGPAKAVYIEDEEESWVAFMAMIPVRLLSESGELRAYFVVNVLVDPKQQGRNLFGRMISAAKAFTASEGSALMGHPNRLAIKAWQRSKMHFHSPLKPAGVFPAPPMGVRHLRLRSVAEPAGQMLDKLCEDVNEASAASPSWQVAISPPFLNWRFTEHPDYAYALHLYAAGERPLGLQVTRPWRSGVHLLIDSFLSRGAPRPLGGLPIPTLAMSAAQTQDGLGQWAVKLPFKNEIPFFLTHPNGPIEARAASGLGLTASDF